MPYFDRFDICEAHYALETDFNVGGIVWERPANKQRRESTGIQLNRIGFQPSVSFRGYPSLSDNGKAIYQELCARYSLPFEET